MNAREFTEQNEKNYLCEYASFSSETAGRLFEEPKCDVRTEYSRDRDRIVHSYAFRRLKHKTQVYISPGGDYFRTRLTHTLEVAQIARTISRALRLNEDLTEAIALGHDLGHTPFGHAGEQALNEICEDGFTHYEQGLRVVDHVEKNGRGLNLTYEVRDGILKHTNMTAVTREGQVVKLADTIAYLNHDIEDAIRAGMISDEDIPIDIKQALGDTKSRRVSTLVNSVINCGAEYIRFDENIKFYHDKLLQFMFDNVYNSPMCKLQNLKAKQMLSNLYKYFYDNPKRMPKVFQELIETSGLSRCVCDYISGMTDNYAINIFKNIFLPKTIGYSDFLNFD